MRAVEKGIVRLGLAPVTIGAVMAIALLPLACRLPNILIADDGYFYAQIAYSLATLGRSTFDGVHTTSGYHLPWAIVLAAVSRALRVVTLDKTIHLYAYIALSLAIALATVRHFFESRALRLCAFVLLLSNFSLTEMVLAAPIMLGILRGAARPESAGVRAPETWLALALPLVRIDLACVPLVIAVFLFGRDARRGLTLAGATALGAAVQVAVTKLAFGHYVGVAAWLKAGRSLRDVPANITANLGASAFQALTFLALLALGGLAIALRRDRSTWCLVLASLSFLGMHTVLSVLRGWYWVPSSMGILFALDHALRAPAKTVPRLERVARASVTLLTLAFVVHALRAQVVYAEDRRTSASFMAQLPLLVPKGAHLYTYDNPGFLGYFSGLDVVDGDGLVNDYDYARRLSAGRLAGYLDEERICYVVVPQADASPVLEIGGLVLHESEVTLLFAVRRHVASQADFALYRIDAPRCLAR